MVSERLNLDSVGHNEVFYLDPQSNLITTRTAEALKSDVYEIHRLFLQYWSDSTKVIRDFTLGYSSLTSAKEINKSVRNNQNRRKSLHTPGSKDTGCSYEDDMTPGCTALKENLVCLVIFASDAYTGLQLRHRARRLKKDDKGSIRPENGERFLAENGTRNKLDEMLMSVINQARKRVVSVDTVALPLPTIKTKAKGMAPYVAKSTRPKLFCDFEGCEYVTIDRSKLDSHKNVHTGLKPFTCCWCGHKFLTSSNLKTHVNKGCADRRTTMKRTPIKIVNAMRLAVGQLKSGKEESKHDNVSENETVTTSPRDETITAPQVMTKRRALLPIQAKPLKQSKLDFTVVKKT
ncbi:uncharacterized protein LOC110845125 [Folsomia candida]|uniref:uncharacterized protein LOC110845125 n=1 Tax=Folsomia candida TaxID=158441 RepID=UPI000B8F88DE|nr:uncharacterized protein LOC110845125 [Folsomia candida]